MGVTETVWFCMEPEDSEVICEHDTLDEVRKCPEGDRADGWTIDEHGDMHPLSQHFKQDCREDHCLR